MHRFNFTANSDKFVRVCQDLNLYPVPNRIILFVTLYNCLPKTTIFLTTCALDKIVKFIVPLLALVVLVIIIPVYAVAITEDYQTAEPQSHNGIHDSCIDVKYPTSDGMQDVTLCNDARHSINDTLDQVTFPNTYIYHPGDLYSVYAKEDSGISRAPASFFMSIVSGISGDSNSASNTLFRESITLPRSDGVSMVAYLDDSFEPGCYTVTANYSYGNNSPYNSSNSSAFCITNVRTGTITPPPTTPTTPPTTPTPPPTTPTTPPTTPTPPPTTPTTPPTTPTPPPTTPTTPPTTQSATIKGTVFKDNNNNNTLDSSDQLFAGIVVTLFKPDGTMPETFTDSVGMYAFTDLDLGVHTVYVAHDNDRKDDSVDLKPGETEINLILSSTPPEPFTITGVVTSSVETPAGVPVTISTIPEKRVITTNSGSYTFTGVIGGKYDVTVFTPFGIFAHTITVPTGSYDFTLGLETRTVPCSLFCNASGYEPSWAKDMEPTQALLECSDLIIKTVAGETTHAADLMWCSDLHTWIESQ